MTKPFRPTVPQITLAALMLALVLAWQYVTAPLGLTIVTDSGVNLLLICCIMMCGYTPGLILAAATPFLARLFWIGQEPILLPFVAVCDIVLVLAWRLITRGKFHEKRDIPRMLIAAISGAVLKTLALFLLVDKLAVPMILNPSEIRAAELHALFGKPQLSTFIGAAAAFILLWFMRKTPDAVANK